MSSVLLDNWSIDRAMSLLSHDSSEGTIMDNDSICWQNLLLAVVLWDKISIITDNRDCRRYPRRSNYENLLGNDILQPIEINRELFSSFSDNNYSISDDSTYDVINDDIVLSCARDEISSIQDDYVENRLRFSPGLQMIQDRENKKHIATIWVERTKAYMGISNELGISYLPHPARAKYYEVVKKELVYKFNRSMLINKIDKDICTTNGHD